MQSADVHVTPTSLGWIVEVEGEGTVSTHRIQDEAIAKARDVARRRGVELVIHGEDGRIREKDSFGNDPRDIAG